MPNKARTSSSTNTCPPNTPAATSPRIPAWCSRPEVAVNGEKVDGADPGSYLLLDRKWKAGDRIALRFPMEERWLMREHHSNYPSYTLPGGEIMYREEPADKTPYAFLRGPIVYCVDMVWNKPLCNDDADLYRDVTIDTGKLPVRTALPDSSLQGPAYRAEADYMGRKVQLTLTPFCNIGQWYRKGEQKPRKNTKAFTYAIWLTGSKN